jgi:hypothetical protein
VIGNHIEFSPVDDRSLQRYIDEVCTTAVLVR